jgi:hypothetical protein
MLDQNLIGNILSLMQFIVALFIAIRAFYLYARTRSRRIFILGLSMLVISLTAGAGFIGDNVTSISLNVDWFNYIGQTLSFLFIALSFIRSSNSYLSKLTRYQILCSIALLLLLILSPVLPAEFPYPALTKSVLSGSRGVICLVIFYCYFVAFIKKESRFSILMSGAFLLLAFGYLTILPKYITPNDTLDRVGDILRIVGVVALLLAVSERRKPQSPKVEEKFASASAQRMPARDIS